MKYLLARAWTDAERVGVVLSGELRVGNNISYIYSESLKKIISSSFAFYLRKLEMFILPQSFT